MYSLDLFLYFLYNYKVPNKLAHIIKKRFKLACDPYKVNNIVVNDIWKITS